MLEDISSCSAVKQDLSEVQVRKIFAFSNVCLMGEVSFNLVNSVCTVNKPIFCGLRELYSSCASGIRLWSTQTHSTIRNQMHP